MIGLLDSCRTICFYGGGAKATEHCGTIQHFPTASHDFEQYYGKATVFFKVFYDQTQFWIGWKKSKREKCSKKWKTVMECNRNFFPSLRPSFFLTTSLHGKHGNIQPRSRHIAVHARAPMHKWVHGLSGLNGWIFSLPRNGNQRFPSYF